MGNASTSWDSNRCHHPELFSSGESRVSLKFAEPGGGRWSQKVRETPTATDRTQRWCCFPGQSHMGLTRMAIVLLFAFSLGWTVGEVIINGKVYIHTWPFSPGWTKNWSLWPRQTETLTLALTLTLTLTLTINHHESTLALTFFLNVNCRKLNVN